MSRISFTQEQQSAILSDGGNILVSAAAGSGKTAVLTERAIRKLIDDKIPADRLMIVTFTRASAAEMKARILKRLSEISSQQPKNMFVRRQISLFERARIGTIHSCCAEILRDNFSLLGLPSDFRLGETDEIKKIELSSVEKILEQGFSSKDPVFLSLAELLGARRNNKEFPLAILKLLNFARSVPFYSQWLDDMPSRYSAPVAKGSSIWEQIIFKEAERELHTALSFFFKAEEFCCDDRGLSPYREAIERDIEALEELEDYIEFKDLDRSYEFLNSFKFASLKAAKDADADDKEYAKALREKGKKAFSNIKEKLILSSYSDFCSDLGYFKPIVQELFDIAKKADRLILSEKLKEKVIDFSDLEQLSLKLLLNKNPDGSFDKTDAAIKLSKEIDEIMIDEYQDVNEVQDAILKAVSNGKNRFMVGDVKQSIYRFRQACPALFINMLSSFNTQKGIYPRKILLNGNFRTRSEITDFINHIFLNLMTEEASEINYSDGHKLIPMIKDPCCLCDPVEIILVEQCSEVSSQEAEAGCAARKIKQLLQSGFTVKDNEQSRPIEACDIAILMRNPKNKAHIYQRALEKEGIKSSALKDEDFLTSFEIKPMVNLLSAICNPTKSMELSGAMLSPLFGFTDEEISQIKTQHSAKNLYSSLHMCKDGSKGKDFKIYFDSLLAFSKTNTPASLISKIYYDTGYKTICSAMDGGEYMEDNLNLLLIYAQSLKERGSLSLNGFLKALEAMKENSVSFSSKGISGRDCVSITSIHSSKGLEWPVVLLCETSSSFSFYQNDLISSYILDRDLGFASLRQDSALKLQFPTVPLASARSLNKRLSTAEEMRLLYVALTRSKEKLIITGSVADTQKRLSDNLDMGDDSVYPDIVYSKKNYLDWILTGMKIDDIEGFYKNKLIKLTAEKYDECEEQKTQEASFDFSGDEQIKDDILKRLSFVYPFERCSKIPSKIAASQLSGNLKSAYVFSKKPEFALGKGHMGSQRGNAFHKFMQLCSFSNARENAEKEAENLVSLNLLREDEKELLSFSKIEGLLSGHIGDIIFSSDKILREYRFFAPAYVSEISRELCDDMGNSAMLEGVADLIAIKDNRLYIIDYKTDIVRNEEELRDLYKNQVLLYKDMLSFSFSLPVSGVFLYSFHLEKEISV